MLCVSTDWRDGLSETDQPINHKQVCKYTRRYRSQRGQPIKAISEHPVWGVQLNLKCLLNNLTVREA